jgi:uncharacterized protein YwbE
MVLRLSRLLSDSKKMRAAALNRPAIPAHPSTPILTDLQPVSFGADLEKVLLAHQEPGEPLPSPPPVVSQAAAQLPAPVALSSPAPVQNNDSQAKVPNRQTADIPQAHRYLVDVARSLFDAVATESVPDSVGTVTRVRETLDLFMDGDALLSEVVRNRRDFRAWPERSVNVAILSMRLGVEMHLDEKRCLALGMCGLTHDLGMLTVPDEILKSSKLNGGQLAMLRRHPQESARILKSFGASFAWIGKIVIQAHERRDGSGYPRGLKGDQVHELAAILGLADTYEAMAHPRPDRKAQAMYESLKQIIDAKNTKFDRGLVKALVRVVSIFPLGSLVRLNTNAIGRVIGTKVAHPTRPELEILVDAKGTRLPEPLRLKLENEPLLNIVDPAIEESDLP